MELGPKDIILGLPWLRSMNLTIDWAGGQMQMNSTKIEEDNGKVELVAANWVQWWCWWKEKILNDTSERLWCAARYTYSTELVEKARRGKQK